jgi:hypothetical protein
VGCHKTKDSPFSTADGIATILRLPSQPGLAITFFSDVFKERKDPKNAQNKLKCPQETDTHPGRT